MFKKFKKTLLIDLDGVLNQYEGNFDENFIPPIKEGAIEFIEQISKDYDLKLFTTRNKILATKWLIEYKIDKYFKDVTNVKDLVWLYIDDRCLTFDGSFKKLASNIKNFKVWYK